VRRGYLKYVNRNEHGNGYPDEGRNCNCQDKKNAEFKILLFIQQAGYIIEGIKIEIGRYEYQVTKLDSYGMGKHQRSISENKNPENISQEPK